MYKKYRENGFKQDDKVIVDRIRNECFQTIRESRERYLQSLGKKLIDKSTGRKTYWSIINTFLNKSKIPRIPPLLVAGSLISDCLEKAKLFNAYFLEQCILLNNNSCLPRENILLTRSKLHTMTFACLMKTFFLLNQNDMQ